MPRRRYVSTEVSIDKRLNKLAETHGDFATLLYTWMVPHAGDDAMLNGDIEEFMATVIPMRRDKSVADVEAALLGMVATGLIVWDGVVIAFPIEAFYRYQTYIKAENRRTADVAVGERSSASDSSQQQPTAGIAGKHCETPKNAVSFSLPPSIPSPPSVTPAGRGAKAPARTKEPFEELTAEERGELLTKWLPTFPDADERIDLALAHEAHWKYPTGQKRYVDNWFKNDQGRGTGNGRMGTGTNANGRGSSPQDDPELKRLRALGVIAE